jgi:hypothetical protein
MKLKDKIQELGFIFLFIAMTGYKVGLIRSAADGLFEITKLPLNS